MQKEAASAGFYESKYAAGTFEKIKIVTVEEILEGKRLAIPLIAEAVKKDKEADTTDQGTLFE